MDYGLDCVLILKTKFLGEHQSKVKKKLTMAGVVSNVNLQKWWSTSDQLPHWLKAFRNSSSAAVERVFGVLNNSLKDEQIH